MPLCSPESCASKSNHLCSDLSPFAHQCFQTGLPSFLFLEQVIWMVYTHLFSPHRTLRDHFDNSCQAAQKIKSYMSRDIKWVYRGSPIQCGTTALEGEEQRSCSGSLGFGLWKLLRLGNSPLAKIWREGQDTVSCKQKGTGQKDIKHGSHCPPSNMRDFAVGLSHFITWHHNLRSAFTEATSSTLTPCGREIRDRHSALGTPHYPTQHSQPLQQLHRLKAFSGERWLVFSDRNFFSIFWANNYL